MGFFDDLPPQPEPPGRPPRPVWAGPPAAVIPAVSSQRPVVLRTKDAALWVDIIRVFPNGLELALSLTDRQSQSGPYQLPPLAALMGPPDLPGRSDDDLRLGLHFADGRRWPSADMFHPHVSPGAMPDLVVMPSGGSGGGEYTFTMTLWVWPLPPAGPLTLVADWRDRGVPETRVEVDSDELRRLAGDAEAIWEE